MRAIVKFAIWLAAAFIGLFVWNTVPDFRPVAIWALPAAIVCYALSLVAQRTIRRLVADELIDLRHQMEFATDRLELLDRKITILLKDALDQRQQR
jgi:hypothetical protein